MGLFDQFPYTNFHELNLDWILKALKELEHTIDQFVAINALKYADPIQWDITSQYEKNTIVIDPQTGTAYISVQPVPIGVSLANTDYWTVVFDLGSFVVRAAKNFANTYEDETTLTATVNTAAGGWLVWGDTLYRANVNITAGDSYVEGGNITHFTLEDVIGHPEDLTTTDKSNLVAAINEIAAEVLGKIGDLADLDTTDKSNLVAAINEVLGNIGALADLDTTDQSNLVAALNEVLATLTTTTGDLADLTTTDQSNLVAAINEVLATLTTTTGDLADLTTTDQSNLVAALNEVLATLTNTTGDLADLDTTDKSSLVAAINELYNTPSGGEAFWHNVKDEFGAVGDGVTDDTQAIKTALAYMQTNRVGLYFPEGDYRITENWVLDDNNNRWFAIRGAHRARTVIRADIASGTLFDLTSSGTFRYCEISEITFYNADPTLAINAFRIYRMSHSIIHDLIFRGFDTSIDAEMSWCMLVYNCEFREHSTGGVHAHMVLSYQCNVWNVISCQFAGRTDVAMFSLTVARAQTSINIQQCTFDHAMGINISHNATDPAPIANINIDNCYFEHMQGLAVRCNIAAAGYIKNVTIKNCYLNAIENGNISYAIDPRYASAITIRDNYCVRYVTAMVSAEAQGHFNDEYELINNITDGVAVYRSPAHEVKGSASAAPTANYHHVGEIVYNNAPSATNYGWLCTTAGTPGTWIAINPS